MQVETSFPAALIRWMQWLATIPSFQASGKPSWLVPNLSRTVVIDALEDHPNHRRRHLHRLKETT